MTSLEPIHLDLQDQLRCNLFCTSLILTRRYHLVRYVSQQSIVCACVLVYVCRPYPQIELVIFISIRVYCSINFLIVPFYMVLIRCKRAYANLLTKREKIPTYSYFDLGMTHGSDNYHTKCMAISGTYCLTGITFLTFSKIVEESQNS